MSHTDSPEDDVACTACETEGSRSRLDKDGLCPDCRTPAGRLVTALAARGVEDAEVAPDGRDAAFVGCLMIDVDEDGRWAIDGHDADGITAADAIAAIVQAPGLRAERDALAARVAELEAHNGRMVAALEAVADRCDAAEKMGDEALYGGEVWDDAISDVVDALPSGVDSSWAALAAALRDLAGGAS